MSATVQSSVRLSPPSSTKAVVGGHYLALLVQLNGVAMTGPNVEIHDMAVEVTTPGLGFPAGPPT